MLLANTGSGLVREGAVLTIHTGRSVGEIGRMMGAVRVARASGKLSLAAAGDMLEALGWASGGQKSLDTKDGHRIVPEERRKHDRRR